MWGCQGLRGAEHEMQIAFGNEKKSCKSKNKSKRRGIRVREATPEEKMASNGARKSLFVARPEAMFSVKC